MTALTPFGKPPLVAERAPRRGDVPGPAGFLAGPNRVALPPHQDEPVEAWQAREEEGKLALASSKEQARLREERVRLQRAATAGDQAERSEVKARESLVAARLDGRNVGKATEAYDRSVAATARARRALSIQQDVVAQLRTMTLAGVRERLEADARSRLGAAHERYDRALDVLSGVPVFIAELAAARTAEAQAAQALADATGQVPGVSMLGRRHDKVLGTRFKTIPATIERVALALTGPDPVTLADAGAVRTNLGRRSEPIG